MKYCEKNNYKIIFIVVLGWETKKKCKKFMWNLVRIYGNLVRNLCEIWEEIYVRFGKKLWEFGETFIFYLLQLPCLSLSECRAAFAAKKKLRYFWTVLNKALKTYIMDCSTLAKLRNFLEIQTTFYNFNIIRMWSFNLIRTNERIIPFWKTIL